MISHRRAGACSSRNTVHFTDIAGGTPQAARIRPYGRTISPCRDRRPDCPKYRSFHRYRGRYAASGVNRPYGERRTVVDAGPYKKNVRYGSPVGADLLGGPKYRSFHRYHGRNAASGKNPPLQKIPFARRGDMPRAARIARNIAIFTDITGEKYNFYDNLYKFYILFA